MSRNDIVIEASPKVVYDALLQPGNYPRFVAGAKQLRDVDDDWPQEGSRFHHKVGVGPIEVADNTKLVDKTPNEHVVLDVRVRPFGTGLVTFDLEPIGRGDKTHVVMTEDFTQGCLTSLPGPIRNGVLRVRNVVTLRRLRRLVTSGHDGRTERA